MCGVCELAVDQSRVDGFSEEMVQILNHGALALMISLGHRTGLFDSMAEMPPATSATIAGRTCLNERYVREWLGAMVTGGIVDYDMAQSTYHLPAEHAACLTRLASPNNLAAFAQYIPQLGSVEDKIVGCFEHGGGVPYAAFTRFQSIMAEDSGQTVLPALLDMILPLMPGMIDRLKSGIDVLDVGCGSGRALNIMAQAFPKSRFVGYDFSEEGITVGRTEARTHDVANIRFEVMDAANMDDIA
ncbi:MAG: class I SAM-dependent methyltransferase, partial [Geminicoccaceae bacterium]